MNCTRTLAALLLTLISTMVLAYRTPGNGTTYTLADLAAIEEANIYKYVDDEDGEIIYILYENDTISAGDKFVMDDDVTVQFDDGVTFVIEGEADFNLEKGSWFESAYGDADYVKPVGIKVQNTVSRTIVSNCNFDQVGLRCMSAMGMTVTDCSFYSNNGAIGQAALTLGSDGAPFTIRGCYFSGNTKAAIAGAANYRNPLLIEDCTFYCNGAANGNTPQLNLTVADSVVIRRCEIEGYAEYDKVGGITVANLMNYEGDYRTVIEDCSVTSCRFGIATYMNQRAYIRRNTLTDNCHEQNAMNGGSGINVYDPYYKQYAYIEGNHIEGSLWGITVVGGGEVNCGRTDVSADDERYNPGGNTFVDNGNGGQLYDLYNNSTNTVYAQGNTWNVTNQTQDEIEGVVFHKADDNKLGEVIYWPAAQATGISKPAVTTTEGAAAYDMQGRCTNATVKGAATRIIIVDGKKVVVRR